MANKTLNNRQKPVFRIPVVTPVKAREPLQLVRGQHVPPNKTGAKSKSR